MIRFFSYGAALALIGAGCGDGGGGTEEDAGATQSVAINFAARVGAESFNCGTVYDGLGANSTSIELTDFRFYLSEIELKEVGGGYVPVELDPGTFQANGIALLDFEDGCGAMGNAPTNSQVTGAVPTGDYDGVRFTMGVPFAINHADPSTATAPMNLTAMNWSWQGGYKFLRIDSGSLGSSDWRMHLGSTGCDGDPVAGGTTACDNSNRVTIEFPSFDVDADTVVADFAALVAGAALDVNATDTPFGCMSGVTDTDCTPLFENLGLAFGGGAAGSQSFFTLE